MSGVDDRRVGTALGRYLIEAVVGQGGFATVYRAQDTVLERSVALKVLDPNTQRDPNIGRRFVREGRAVASLDHSAIVPVYDAGYDDGLLWLAMKLVVGGSVADALIAGRTFSTTEVVTLIERIASALDHAHSHGILHRDVKPSNILLENGEAGTAWLTDFGIAATARDVGTYTTGALGTAAYMAPEQARPKQVGPASDLYSLGCVAYELLVGRRPFPGDDYVELLMAHATEPVPSTGRQTLDELMTRALAKDPVYRPPTGRVLVQELRHALAVDTPPTSPVAHRPEGRPAEPPPHAPTVVEHRAATMVNPNQVPLPAGAATGATSPGAPDRSRPVRLLIAAAALVAAVTVGLWLSQRANVDTAVIRDPAGARYEIPEEWSDDGGSSDGQRGVLTLSLNGTTMATVEHEPSGQSAEEACGGDVIEVLTVSGSDETVRCATPEGDVLAAVANGETWVFRFSPEVATDDQDHLVDTLEFVTPS